MAESEEIKLKDLSLKFKDEVLNGNFFWRTDPPRSYMRGMLFSGINFAILGLNILNEQDQRWITQGEIKENNYTVKDSEKATPILLYAEGICDTDTGEIIPDNEKISLFSSQVFNVWQLDEAIPAQTNRLRKLDLNSMLPSYKIPYKTQNGITYFSIRNNRETENLNDPLKMLRGLCKNQLIKLNATNKKAAKPGSKYDFFNDLAIELASCRIAHTLACSTPLDENLNVITNKIKGINFENAEMQLRLYECFNFASLLEKQLLSENEFNEPSKEMPDYMRQLVSNDEWELINNQEQKTGAFYLCIDDLKHACEECMKANNNDIAYLRYISDSPDDDQRLEFYPTSIAESGLIAGYFMTNNELLSVQIESDTIFANFDLDITFTSCYVSELE